MPQSESPNQAYLLGRRRVDREPVRVVGVPLRVAHFVVTELCGLARSQHLTTGEILRMVAHPLILHFSPPSGLAAWPGSAYHNHSQEDISGSRCS